MFVEAKYFIHFMERQKKVMMAAEGGDRLSNLPESILLYILSLLPNSKQVVQTSVLSSQWRFLWKSVPVSIEFDFSDGPKAYREKHILAYVASVNRELHYWRFCEKIKSFSVFIHSYVNIDRDIDFWVYFATNIGKVEEFWLKFYVITYPDLAYKFPEFGYTNTVLRKLALGYCQVKPYGNVNWSNLISLSIGDIDITEDVMEKVLLGSPNLECLELDNVVSIRRLEISSVNLRKMILKHDSDDCHCLEIHAPYIRHLELWGLCCKEKHFQLRDVGSLVTAVLSINVYIPKNAEKECKYLRELLHHVAHVENLELSPCCIECLSILELKGLPIPPSNWKFLKLNAALEKLDYPGICNFLSSSSNLETLIIDWFNRKPRKLLSKCTNEDERWRKLWTRYFNCSLPHLKTIKFINCCEKPMENNVVQPLVKWLQKNATALKEFVISSRRNRGK